MARNAKTFLLVATLLSVSAAAIGDSARFDSDGVQIHYVTSGTGEAVVMLHGFSGSANGAWIRPGTFDAIAAAGFMAIAMDHRGHGESDKPHDPASYGVQMAEDVRRLLDHLDIQQAHIVGYSMGAKVANTFRSRYPWRVRTITLGGYGWPWRATDESLEEAREGLNRREIMPGNDLDALAAYRVSGNSLVPSADTLRANRLPTLSIVGSEDTAVPAKDVQELRLTMSNVTVIDMPGTHAGDTGALYKPRFAAEIINFIASHAGR